VKLHSVFLRNGCALPGRLDPLREPCGDHWTHLEEIAAPVFDTMIRQAGWHFMWLQGSCTRKGFGFTAEKATGRALARALNGVTKRFNAAELDSVQVTKYPGFHIANVTMHSRQIQQYTLLETIDGRHPRPVSGI
jgi:hypothetical protein